MSPRDEITWARPFHCHRRLGLELTSVCIQDDALFTSACYLSLLSIKSSFFITVKLFISLIYLDALKYLVRYWVIEEIN